MIQVCKMFTATDCRINIQPKRDIDFLKGFIFKVGFLIVLLNLTELTLLSDYLAESDVDIPGD